MSSQLMEWWRDIRTCAGEMPSQLMEWWRDIRTCAGEMASQQVAKGGAGLRLDVGHRG